MSDKRRARRLHQLEFRRQAKKRGIRHGSQAYLVFLMLVSQGVDYDAAVALIAQWEAERAEELAESE